MIAYDTLIDKSKGSLKDFFVLARHFYFRLFLNDAVFFEEQMKEKVIALLAIIAIFSAHLANSILYRYLMFPDTGTSWVEKSYFMSYLMVLMGFITVLQWDVLFPDRRDFANLIALPVKIRIVFASKFASLCIFIGIFAVGANTLSALIFSLYLPSWQSESLFFALRYVVVHLVCSFSSCFFIFFFSILLIGILQTVLGYKWFHHISVYLRAALMVALVFLMILFFSETITVSGSMASFPGIRENNPGFFLFFPPMWFTGLYETLLGQGDPFFHGLARIAVLALVIPTLVFFLSAALSYKRYLRTVEETKRKRLGFAGIRNIFNTLVGVTILRNPVQKAVCAFFGKTLRKSMLHRMRLAVFLAVAVGMMLVVMVSRAAQTKVFSTFDKSLLSIPLILSFFLLVGVSRIVNIPVSLDANWIFRLTEAKDRKQYILGLKKGIVFFAVGPMYGLLFVFYSMIWDWETAALHCLFGLAVSLLLIEVFFFRFRKIPFTCSYLPGKEQMHVLWMVYIAGFILYITVFTALELSFGKNQGRFYLFYAIVLIVVVAWNMFQNHFLLRGINLRFEEKPEPAMIGLATSDY
ncbi:MAG: hypothetical protein JXB23_13625 [Candidatus Aminicenantes bacterium]|nr:hypothetical protein [Candidatus Aminicenantes bacterium]